MHHVAVGAGDCEDRAYGNAIIYVTMATTSNCFYKTSP
jgi:hypothetical protein